MSEFRWPIYLIVFVGSIVLLVLLLKARRRHIGLAVEMNLLLFPTVLGLVHGAIMVARTVYYWSAGMLWRDPPLHGPLAATANGVILIYVIALVFCTKEKLAHG